MECFSSSNTLNLRLSSVGLGPYGYAYRPPAILDPYNKRPRPLAAASLPLSLHRCTYAPINVMPAGGGGRGGRGGGRA